MFLELFLVQDSHTKIKRNRYGNLGCCLPRRGIKNYWYVKKCQNLTMSNRSVLQTALEYKPRLKINLHCNPVQGQYRARTGFSLCTFSHREKPVFITGNLYSHCRDPVSITGISLWEKVHRENRVFITRNGFAVYLIVEMV